MEWVNLVGFILVVVTTLIGIASYVAACSPYRIDHADKKKGNDADYPSSIAA
jgi:hypothetical protein